MGDPHCSTLKIGHWAHVLGFGAIHENVPEMPSNTGQSAGRKDSPSIENLFVFNGFGNTFGRILCENEWHQFHHHHQLGGRTDACVDGRPKKFVAQIEDSKNFHPNSEI